MIVGDLSMLVVVAMVGNAVKMVVGVLGRAGQVKALVLCVTLLFIL